jgi:hypothetical protein
MDKSKAQDAKGADAKPQGAVDGDKTNAAAETPAADKPGK